MKGKWRKNGLEAGENADEAIELRVEGHALVEVVVVPSDAMKRLLHRPMK